MNWENIDIEAFGQLVRNSMESQGIRAYELSDQLMMSKRIVSEVINGRRRLNPYRYKEISDFLEIQDSDIPMHDSVPPVNSERTKKQRVFISYSHKDQLYLDRLLVHLKPLEKKGLIDPWTDTRLLAGDKWKKEIESALKDSKAAILMVSADFLASDFIIDNELPPILQLAEEKGTLILPIILRPCRYNRDSTLREFQAINSPDEPICLVNEDERELIYDIVAQRIEEAFG